MLESCLETLCSRSGFSAGSGLGAAGGSSVCLRAVGAGRATALHPTPALRPSSRSIPSLPERLCRAWPGSPAPRHPCAHHTPAPNSFPVCPPLPGGGERLLRVAVVPWGSPASALQLGGGNPHLLPKHHEQNSPHCREACPLPREGHEPLTCVRSPADCCCHPQPMQLRGKRLARGPRVVI